MPRLLAVCALSLLAISTSVPNAHAQHAVDGVWQATVTLPDRGALQFLFEFHTEGRTVTGTVAVDTNPPVPIQNGRIRGDDVIAFERESSADDEEKLIFAGKVLGDEISFGVARIRGPAASPVLNFTATRLVR